MKRPSEISDVYERLGVSSDASMKEITTAYKKLVKHYHPLGYTKNPEVLKFGNLEINALTDAYAKLVPKENFREGFFQAYTEPIIDENDRKEVKLKIISEFFKSDILNCFNDYFSNEKEKEFLDNFVLKEEDKRIIDEISEVYGGIEKNDK